MPCVSRTFQDPLCAILPKGHPLADKEQIEVEYLLEYPFIIETPGCDNDILHLLGQYARKPQVSYSFRDDTLIMAFVKDGLGVTISQKLVMSAFADEAEIRMLKPECFRTIGLAFSRTTNSVVAGTLLHFLQKYLSYDLT